MWLLLFGSLQSRKEGRQEDKSFHLQGKMQLGSMEGSTRKVPGQLCLLWGEKGGMKVTRRREIIFRVEVDMWAQTKRCESAGCAQEALCYYQGISYKWERGGKRREEALRLNIKCHPAGHGESREGFKWGGKMYIDHGLIFWWLKTYIDHRKLGNYRRL